MSGKKVKNVCSVAQHLINIGEARGKTDGGTLKLYELVQEGLLSVSDAAKHIGVSEDTFINKMKLCGYNLPK